MNRVLMSRLYRRLTQSPKYRRTGGVYLHETWMEVIIRRIVMDTVHHKTPIHCHNKCKIHHLPV